MAQLLAIIFFGVAIQRAESRLLHGDSKQAHGPYVDHGVVNNGTSEDLHDLMNSPAVVQDSEGALKIGADGGHILPGAADASRRTPSVFGPQYAISAESSKGVWIADLDFDGLADVLTVNPDIAWHRNLGGGNFATKSVISDQVQNPQDVSTADLDNDGLIDVLSASYGDGKIAWYKNLGSGAFASQSVIWEEAVGGGARAFAVDLNNDGNVDVLAAFYHKVNKIVWYQNLGGGSFASESIISTQGGCWDVYAIDLDGDSYADVIRTDHSGNKVSWYKNLGDGSFDAERVLTTDVSTPWGVFAIDLDNDGDNDVLSASHMKLAFYENLGGGSFSTQSIISNDCSGSQTVHAIDVDSDGNFDVIANCGYDVVWVRNLGGGSFGSKSTIMSGYGEVRQVYAADLDNDGDGDIVAAKYAGPAVLVSINESPTPVQPAPAPAASATGDPHLENIHGERFDLMRPGNAVLIQIPRGQPFEKSWLTVKADARRLGSQCADMYFQSLNITGAWADKVRAGGLTFTAAGSRDEKLQIPGWTQFGPLKLKVVHGRTSQGIEHLNFYVKHLREAGAAVGGLLGEDDYTEVATPEEGCRKSMSLGKKAISNSDVGRTEAIASLA